MAGLTWLCAVCLASPAVEYELRHVPRRDQVYGPDARRGHTLGMEPVRIALFVDDLTCTGPEGRCRCENVGDQVSDFQGGVNTCTQDDVLTVAKEDFLKKILAEAVMFLQEAIGLNRVATKLLPGAHVCGIPQNGDLSDIRGVNLPDGHYDDGIPNTDFVVYATAAPGGPDGQTQAWALSCQLDANERPIMAMINFVPSILPPDPTTLPAIDYLNAVNTAIHELFHALGYSLQFFNSPKWFPKYPIEQVGGKYFFSTPKVIERARLHFNCSTLVALELENQGGSGTKLSHWEKRIFGNEAMTGAQADDVSVVSDITLAYFEDTGFYTVNYSKAGVLRFGKNRGCEFLEQRCDDITPRYEYCFPQSSDLYTEQCTASLMAHGPCATAMYSEAIDEEYRYFSNPRLGGHVVFADYCPIYSAQIQCLETDIYKDVCLQQRTAAECDALSPNCLWGSSCVSTKYHIKGETFGPSSRCFTADTVAQGWEQLTPSRCFDVTCAPDGRSYSLRVGVYDLYCGENNTIAISPYGFSDDWKGKVPCHDPELICDGTVQVGEVPSPPPAPDTPAPGEKKLEIKLNMTMAAAGGAALLVVFVILVVKCKNCKARSRAARADPRAQNTFVMPPATVQSPAQEVNLSEVTMAPLHSPLLREQDDIAT